MPAFSPAKITFPIFFISLALPRGPRQKNNVWFFLEDARSLVCLQFSSKITVTVLLSASAIGNATRALFSVNCNRIKLPGLAYAIVYQQSSFQKRYDFFQRTGL